MAMRKLLTFLVLFLVIFTGAVYAEDKPAKRMDNYIAVFDLEAVDVDKKISHPLTESIRLELVLSNKYEVIDRGNMNKILGEQKFQMSGCVSGQCIVEAGQLLGVGKIVAGSVSMLGKTYYLSLSLINVKTGKIEMIAEDDCKCEVDDLLKSSKRLAKKLLGEQISEIPQKANAPSAPAKREVSLPAGSISDLAGGDWLPKSPDKRKSIKEEVIKRVRDLAEKDNFFPVSRVDINADGQMNSLNKNKGRGMLISQDGQKNVKFLFVLDDDGKIRSSKISKYQKDIGEIFSRHKISQSEWGRMIDQFNTSGYADTQTTEGHYRLTYDFDKELFVSSVTGPSNLLQKKETAAAQNLRNRGDSSNTSISGTISYYTVGENGTRSSPWGDGSLTHRPAMAVKFTPTSYPITITSVDIYAVNNTDSDMLFNLYGFSENLSVETEIFTPVRNQIISKNHTSCSKTTITIPATTISSGSFNIAVEWVTKPLSLVSGANSFFLCRDRTLKYRNRSFFRFSGTTWLNVENVSTANGDLGILVNY